MTVTLETFDPLHPICDLLQLADESGNVVVDFIASEPFVIVTELDLGFPEPRDVVQSRAAQSGTIDTTKFYGARAVALSLSIVPGALEYVAALQLLSSLRTLCVPNRRPWLYVRMVDEPTTIYRIQLRADSISGPLSWNMTPQYQWRAPSGVLETLAASSVSIHPNGGDVIGGFHSPFSSPFDSGSGFASGAIAVDVNSTVPTPPLLTVWGPCEGPISIINQTTGESLNFPALDIPLGSNVQIDCEAHTVLANGDPSTSRLSFRDPSTSTFWWLQPGINNISFQPTNPGPDCELIMTWRDRKI